eukprot:scaffold93731_cov78-Phaeocystis_antarctica.AAC.8
MGTLALGVPNLDAPYKNGVLIWHALPLAKRPQVVTRLYGFVPRGPSGRRSHAQRAGKGHRKGRNAREAEPHGLRRDYGAQRQWQVGGGARVRRDDDGAGERRTEPRGDAHARVLGHVGVARLHHIAE